MKIKLALIIGIDRYREIASEHHLHCAAADARAVEKTLREVLGFTTVLLLDTQLGYGDAGNAHVIFEQLRKWREQLKSGDEVVLVIYFAGHGVTVDGRQFLLAPDAPIYAFSEPVAGDIGTIMEETLCRTTRNWPNTRRAFFIDACRDAINIHPSDVVGMAKRSGIALRTELLPEKQDIDEPDLDSDLVVFRSCPPDQVAYELRNYGESDEKKNNGLYTAALLSILEKRAANEGRIELDESLNRDVSNEMSRLALRYAPAKYKEAAQNQRPERHGAVVCLADARDFRAMKVARLLDQFEVHFAAQRYSKPITGNCSDTLRKLMGLDYSEEKLGLLAQRVAAAEREEEIRIHKMLGERLVQTARLEPSYERWSAVAHHYLPELHEEAEEFIREWTAKQDESAWRDVLANLSVDACQRYLRRFPAGLHRIDAHKHIAALAEEQAVRREAQDWAQVQSGTLDDIKAFTKRWPDGAHIEFARQAIASLELELLEQADARRWAVALSESENGVQLEVLRLALSALQTETWRARCADELRQFEQKKAEQEIADREHDAKLWAQVLTRTRTSKIAYWPIVEQELLLANLRTIRAIERCKGEIKRQQAARIDEKKLWSQRNEGSLKHNLIELRKKFPGGRYRERLAKELAEIERKEAAARLAEEEADLAMMEQADAQRWADAWQASGQGKDREVLRKVLSELVTDSVRQHYANELRKLIQQQAADEAHDNRCWADAVEQAETSDQLLIFEQLQKDLRTESAQQKCRERIAAIAHDRKAEQLLWLNHKTGDPKRNLEEMRRQFPKGGYAQAAVGLIEVLQRDEDWAMAADLDTEQSYAEFLRKYKEGKYVELAMARRLRFATKRRNVFLVLAGVVVAIGAAAGPAVRWITPRDAPIPPPVPPVQPAAPAMPAPAQTDWNSILLNRAQPMGQRIAAWHKLRSEKRADGFIAQYLSTRKALLANGWGARDRAGDESAFSDWLNDGAILVGSDGIREAVMDRIYAFEHGYFGKPDDTTAMEQCSLYVRSLDFLPKMSIGNAKRQAVVSNISRSLDVALKSQAVGDDWPQVRQMFEAAEQRHGYPFAYFTGRVQFSGEKDLTGARNAFKRLLASPEADSLESYSVAAEVALEKIVKQEKNEAIPQQGRP